MFVRVEVCIRLFNYIWEGNNESDLSLKINMYIIFFYDR